jgi:hypothetical protein
VDIIALFSHDWQREFELIALENDVFLDRLYRCELCVRGELAHAAQNVVDGVC